MLLHAYYFYQCLFFQYLNTIIPILLKIADTEAKNFLKDQPEHVSGMLWMHRN